VTLIPLGRGLVAFMPSIWTCTTVAVGAMDIPVLTCLGSRVCHIHIDRIILPDDNGIRVETYGKVSDIARDDETY
jgi:hypothetical protein